MIMMLKKQEANINAKTPQRGRASQLQYKMSTDSNDCEDVVGWWSEVRCCRLASTLH